jgi:hypothetical protein
MKVVDIANEIYIDSGSPSSTSVPAIAFWIRGKVGEINNLLFEDFTINDALEIVDGDGEISFEAVSIIKKLYKIYDYEISVRSNMNALASDSIIEVTDQGSSIRKVNRNEVSKTFVNLKNIEEESLQRLITSYRLRGASPQQVTGDDEVRGYNGVGGYTVTDLRVGNP